MGSIWDSYGFYYGFTSCLLVNVGLLIGGLKVETAHGLRYGFVYV